jgi:outer membrane immunogenic protein
MKKLLFGTVAVAAMVAGAAMAQPMASTYDWTGVYIGVNGGYGVPTSQSVNIVETSGGTLFTSGSWHGTGNFGQLKPQGGFGGGQIGYNWQKDNWVVGGEADYQGGDITDSNLLAVTPYTSPGSSITVAANSTLHQFGTVRARAGFAFDKALIYATGGVAFGDARYRTSMTDSFGFTSHAQKTAGVGYVVGGGVEYAVAPNWTVRAEYDYMDFGSVTASAPEIGSSSGFAISSRQH